MNSNTFQILDKLPNDIIRIIASYLNLVYSNGYYSFKFDKNDYRYKLLHTISKPIYTPIEFLVPNRILITIVIKPKNKYKTEIAINYSYDCDKKIMVFSFYKKNIKCKSSETHVYKETDEHNFVCFRCIKKNS